jgi:hypothetical protein
MNEVDARRAAARMREHELGEVEAYGVGAPLRGPRRDVPGPRRDVQHALARPGADRVEERIGQARRHTAGQGVVVGRLLRSPADFLERVERDRVVFAHDRKYGNICPPASRI